MRDLGQRGGRGLHPVGVFLIHGTGHIAVGDVHRLEQRLVLRHQGRDGSQTFLAEQLPHDGVALLRTHTLESLQHAHDRAHSVGLELLLQLVGVDLEVFVDALAGIGQAGFASGQHVDEVFHGGARHFHFGPGGLESRSQSRDVLRREA